MDRFERKYIRVFGFLAGKMSDPSPLQTRSARKKKAELAALEGTPVKGATPAKGTPAKAVAAKKLNPTKSATKKTAKAAKTEDSEDTELCLKLEEDGMDSDDLDSDDDEDNALGNGAEGKSLNSTELIIQFIVSFFFKIRIEQEPSYSNTFFYIQLIRQPLKSFCRKPRTPKPFSLTSKIWKPLRPNHPQAPYPRPQPEVH